MICVVYSPIDAISSRLRTYNIFIILVIIGYEPVRFPFLRIMEYEKTIPHLMHVIEDDLIERCSFFHALKYFNNSGLLIDSNCSLTRYLWVSLCAGERDNGNICFRLIVRYRLASYF